MIYKDLNYDFTKTQQYKSEQTNPKVIPKYIRTIGRKTERNDFNLLKKKKMITSIILFNNINV